MPSLDLTGQTFAVFGFGNIGYPIIERLVEARAQIYAFTRSGSVKPWAGSFAEWRLRDLRSIKMDVTSPYDSTSTMLLLSRNGITAINGIIYAVGSCPPGGLLQEVRTPLGEVASFQKWESAVALHCTGLLNVYGAFDQLLVSGGHFVTIGARVADTTPEQVPEGLHLWHYAAAKSAQKKLVHGFRYQEQQHRKFHWIAPGAVDCPFHEKAPASAKVPVSAVVDAVMAALQSDHHVDKVIVPTPA